MNEYALRNLSMSKNFSVKNSRNDVRAMKKAMNEYLNKIHKSD